MRFSRYAAGGMLALSCLALPAPGLAQIPAMTLASMGKEILQNVIFGSVKNELLGSLAGMGCKGAALAGLIATAQTKDPRGGALRSGMSPGIGDAGTIDPAMMQKAMEMMQQQQGRMSPEQQAMMQKAMAQMQGAMAQPLSREETKGVFDEMADIGLLTGQMRDEVKDCITYAPPGAGDSLGAAGAVLKTTVLPAARQAKERMAAATPEEQKQLADGMVDALNSASAADRKAFLEGFGAGFFPQAVVDQVRARVK